jgi:glycosyltransferase involved in cell wall biosynthesis
LKIATTYTGMFPPIKGYSGGDRRIRDIIRGLAQDNNKAFMLVPNFQDPNKENSDADFEIKYLGSKKFRNIPIINRIFYWIEVVKFAKTNSLDALLFYGPFLESVIPSWILKKTKVKILMEVCDLHSTYSNRVDFLKRYYVIIGEKWMPKVTDTNIVISKYIYDFVEKYAPKIPILTIPILVDSGAFKADDAKAEIFRTKYGINPNDVVITYIGAMWFHEGVDVLINAFNNIKDIPNAKLVITGDLTMKANYLDVKKMVKELALEDRVITTGMVDTIEIKEVLNGSDILCVPQNNSSFNLAGLPTKLAEYSAVGKSVIVSEIGDINRYFKHMENAYLCPPSNVEAFTAGLKILIEDKNLRQKLSKNIRITAEKVFDYKVNGNLILDAVYKIKK